MTSKEITTPSQRKSEKRIPTKEFFHCSSSVTSATRNPMIKSVIKGLTPSTERRAERQSDSKDSQAPPRITLTPIALESGPRGSVTDPPGYGPYQSWHHSQTFPS